MIFCLHKRVSKKVAIINVEFDNRVVNENGCVPWNFPSADDSMPPCKPMERHKFLQVLISSNILRSAFFSETFLFDLPFCVKCVTPVDGSLFSVEN